MQELMLINPRRRRRGRRKMSSLQASYFGGGRKRRHRRRSVAALSASRPARRRSRSVMRLKRNPSLRSATSSFMSGIVPAATGAAGAFMVDYALAQFGPSILPASFLSGSFYPVTKIAAAVGIGMLAGMVAGRSVGNQVTAGALVVTGYDLLKQYVAPSLGLSGMNRYVGQGQLGRYMGPRPASLGYLSPARTSPMFKGGNMRAVVPR